MFKQAIFALAQRSIAVLAGFLVAKGVDAGAATEIATGVAALAVVAADYGYEQLKKRN